MNMVHDMDKEVYKVCSCPRIKSYMHCTHIRKGMWVVGSEAISYFLREHPRTNQLLFDLFFNASSLFLTVLLLYIPSLLSRARGQGCPQVFKR